MNTDNSNSNLEKCQCCGLLTGNVLIDANYNKLCSRCYNVIGKVPNISNKNKEIRKSFEGIESLEKSK